MSFHGKFPVYFLNGSSVEIDSKDLQVSGKGLFRIASLQHHILRNKVIDLQGVQELGQLSFIKEKGEGVLDENVQDVVDEQHGSSVTSRGSHESGLNEVYDEKERQDDLFKEHNHNHVASINMENPIRFQCQIRSDSNVQGESERCIVFDFLNEIIRCPIRICGTSKDNGAFGKGLTKSFTNVTNLTGRTNSAGRPIGADSVLPKFLSTSSSASAASGSSAVLMKTLSQQSDGGVEVLYPGTEVSIRNLAAGVEELRIISCEGRTTCNTWREFELKRNAPGFVTVNYFYSNNAVPPSSDCRYNSYAESLCHSLGKNNSPISKLIFIRDPGLHRDVAGVQSVEEKTDLQAIINALPRSLTLTELECKLHLSDEKLERIFGEAVKKMPVLFRLRIMHAQRFPYIQKSVEVGQYFRCLQHLDLSTSLLGDEGADQIGKGLLCVSKTLKHLYLARSQITRVGAESIAVGIRKSPSIRVLDLAENYLAEKGINIIAQAVERSTSLEALNIAHCWEASVAEGIVDICGRVIARYEASKERACVQYPNDTRNSPDTSWADREKKTLPIFQLGMGADLNIFVLPYVRDGLEIRGGDEEWYQICDLWKKVWDGSCPRVLPRPLILDY